MLDTFDFNALPKLILLGGNSSLRPQIAALLTEEDLGMFHLSFASPLREAMRGCFFNGDPSIQVTPGTLLTPTLTDSDFLAGFHQFLQDRCGNGVLGEILFRALKEDQEYFDRFIIDDLNPDFDNAAATLLAALPQNSGFILNLFASEPNASGAKMEDIPHKDLVLSDSPLSDEALLALILSAITGEPIL